MLKELIEEAKNTDLDSFLRLIRECKELIDHERIYGIKYGRVDNTLIEVESDDMLVIGDIHGDLNSLRKILMDNDPFSSDILLVFLGDYGDRGRESVEVYHLILALKSILKDRVILLRGNHEYPWLRFMPHDLPSMLYERFNDEIAYNELLGLFSILYNALINQELLMLHGGMPIRLNSKNDLASNNMIEEILWNDPKDGIDGYMASLRGYGYFFGKNITLKGLNALGCSRLIRSHEPCNGYKINHDGLVLTIFSSKEPYGNRLASYLRIDGSTSIIDNVRIF